MTHSTDQIAIIGIGCRLPGGATGPRTLWRLLEDGVDAVGPVPEGRWDVDRYYSPRAQQPGRISAREGGFLSEVDTFDAAFFGISARVAEQMDPQQRLMLEVAWETLEDAGTVPDRLAGASAGVFLGACSQDYGALQSSPGEVSGLGAHSATGTFMSILSNRLSYTFDLRGPSMTIDTACSSSLVAVHLAVESLRRGECGIALAGGVNLMLTPQFGIALSQAAMLSPDGRSRAFDAAANGYVRGEGAGMVVLKPLEQALRDHDRVYAVIRGSAVNQDGRTQGITVPSGEAQAANFRLALERAGVAPGEVGYVEAHGTGTPVGDPIEAAALGEVLTGGAADRPAALMGSVKTNIGHLEAAAGIAGLIKAALSVHHRRVPPSLHFTAGNPDIDFDRLRLDVPTTARPWPSGYERAIASVNSFGFGGTNANVVLEGPPPAGSAPRVTGQPAVLTFSARSEAALRELVAAHADRLDADHPVLDELGAALALRRGHHRFRLAVAADTAGEAAGKLREHLAGGSPASVVAGTAAPSRTGRVAFLFNGQGPQWYAMGRTLLETSPVFRDKIIECDEVARPYLGWSILEALTADEESSRVGETHCLQPTMFALQVALAELWKSWGVTPDAVAGHSMGEIAAAHLGGALDLGQALRVICTRARIQEKADPSGGMMFVALPRDEAEELCENHPGLLWVSAENSSGATTLSGRRPVLERVEAELRERDVFARLLKVNCACHSQDMDPLRDELLTEIAGVTGSPATIPIYSTVTGERIEGTELDTGYWWRNFRQPVLFAPAIRSMLAEGIDTFVELSPHPVLVNSLREVFGERGADAVAIPTLARNKDDWERFRSAFATLYASGYQPDWAARYPDGAPVLDLPGNPWVRERYWNESAISWQYRAGGQTHPVLKRVDGPRPSWEIDWNDHRLSWVHEHDVLGSVIVPGATYVEAALAAAQEVTGQACALEYVAFERACVLDGEPQLSRLEMDPDTGTFEFHQRPARGQNWVRNARGRFHPAGPTREETVDLDSIRARCTASHKAVDVYGELQRRGYAYGPAFCGIAELHTGSGEALARIKAPRVLRNRLAGHLMHPAVLDACFQSAILHPADGDTALLPFRYLPTGIDAVRVHGPLAGAEWCHTVAHKHDGSGLSVDVRVFDARGRLLAEFAPLTGKVVPDEDAASDRALSGDLYRFRWERQDTGRNLPSAVRSAPLQLCERLGPLQREYAVRYGRDRYKTGYQHQVRRLASGYVADALRRFGQELAPGTVVAPRELPGLLPKYRTAVAGLVRFLAEDGLLREEDGHFHVEADPVEPPDWADVLREHPSCVWELNLLRRTGSRLHDVLTGQTDPLELLFPQGSGADAEPVYQTSPIARFHNRLLKEAVDQLVRDAAPGRTVRVLEVGGGTGGLTASLLPALPPDRCEYVFTDVSPAFVAGARERFRDYGFVDYRTLDLENDLEAQGLRPASFDLVVAADVVHATADLKRTLLGLHEALAPGGILALLEALPGNRWLDLTFGLTDGWWSFRDLSVRTDGPLLPAASWQHLLTSVGFDEVAATGDDGPGSQAVLLARAAGSVEQAPPPAMEGTWLIVDGGDELASHLAARITALGGSPVVVPSSGADGEYRQLLESLRPRAIVQFGTAGRDPVGAAIDDAATTVALLRAVEEADTDRPRCFVLTRGTHAFRNPSVRLGGSAAWGIGTVAGLELPHTEFTVIDLDPGSDDVDSVLAQLCIDDAEGQVALRAGERFVRRLVPLPATEVETPVDGRELPEGQRFAVGIGQAGALDELGFHAAERAAPGAGQVEVRVVAAGLNFLDVMTALGQVPPLDSAGGLRFGAECAGVVTRVGPDVDGVSVGQPVIAVCAEQGTLASHLVVDARCVVAKPDSLGFEEAAGMPIAFLTAWYALHELARVRAGERVLIHSGTGGTGLALVQLAVLAGAEVFATAGSPEKRELLRALGVRHVMDSRSLDFADQVRAATGGEGVDVVVNSIAGDAVARGLASLASYGRFVELGKRDLLADAPIGLRPFLNNLSYFGFDLRQRLADRPDEVREALTGLLDLVRQGRLHPLPYRVFPPAETTSAFRRLAAARHIGKLVVAMDEHEVPVQPVPAPEGPRGTWLVTGGLGGFGLAMAEQLVADGVRSLVLAGRSGASSDTAVAAVDKLRAAGAEVVTAAVDVTSRAELAALLDRVDRELPPLRGILHGAMVLDDGVLTDLDRNRMATVVAPKALGAWHLHELTADRPLDAFVLFSSATSMLGNAGQANYAAANAFLDHLAEARRAAGLPALAVNWGAVADAGYVARHGDVARKVAATGMRAFPVADAYRVLDLLRRGSHAQVGVLPTDWNRFLAQYPVVPPRYAHVADGTGDDGTNGGGRDSDKPLRHRLGTISGQAREGLMKEALSAKVAAVLGIPLDALDDRMPLMDYLDSLLAAEISSWIERESGVKVTIMELMKGPTVVELSGRLLTRLDEKVAR
ncbi:type I polyketide synthase [Amycolatopsis endophytica]|uniref:Acyl transferase domain-containing protein/NADPH:quinone reductase-like Zn-dependent oxidoreductase/short-subunit dehydrogenase/aryl carrier-like protein n=1 Tax=Amycolatopsis endophytica TaxID=860233 RepID=A0A853B1P6_9PSEU|nr:type I polyketide synthase [Amycolatopsis endophytica]NYI88701.1 acyl transferase domain-containing protein/NADPH:quinone reductase-like Zn-dependent oxidoreductase/short-subunit dehydrogenase/aryl carrier-like protein [Amycolatopsis endophytica]